MSENPIIPDADREIRCLSCGAPSGARFLETIPYREIWTRLHEEWGASFSEDVLRRHTPCGETALLECPRSGRALLELLDCPPHRLTRWSSASLAALARRSNLLPAEVATEPVELSIPRDRLRENIQGAVGKVPVVGGLLGTWLPRAAWRVVFFPPLLSLYRRYRVLERAGFFGLSVAVHCVETPL